MVRLTHHDSLSGEIVRRRLAEEELKPWQTHYPKAERVRVVLDNLSTHTPAALYESFEPA